MMSWFGIVSIVFGFAFSGFADLPPLPDDPNLFRVAPERCLAYLSWNGSAEPDAKSGNHAERLLAEPSVRRCFSTIERQFDLFLRSRSDSPIARELPAAVRTILSRPSCLYVEAIELNASSPRVRAALVVNAGEERAQLVSALETLTHVLAPTSEPDANGWRAIPLWEMAEVHWGIKGEYLVVALGREVRESLERHFEGPESRPVPQWLASMNQALSVPRPISRAYVDVSALIELVGPLGPEGLWLRLLGLNDLESIAAVSGMDETGVLHRSALTFEAEVRHGLLAALGTETLDASALRGLPGDSTVAWAGRLDLLRGFDGFVRELSEHAPREYERFARGLEEFEFGLRLRVREDLLEPLGDRWCVHSSPSRGGLLFTGLTVVVSIDDHERARESLDRLVSNFVLDWGLAVPRLRHGEHTIESLEPIADRDWIVAPAWCLTDDRLVIAAYPQMVAEFLTGAQDDSLAKRKDIAALFAGPAPLFSSSIDLSEVAKTLYPLLLPMATALFTEIHKAELSIDVSVIPPLGTVLPHLLPLRSKTYWDGPRLVSESHHSLPYSPHGAVLPAIALGIGAMRSSGGIPPTVLPEEVPARDGPETVLEYRFEYLPTATGSEDEQVEFMQTLHERLQERFGSSGWALGISLGAKDPTITVWISPPVDRARIDAFRKHIETVGQISIHAVADQEYQEPAMVEQVRQEVAAWEAKCAEARRAGKPLPPRPARLVVEDDRGHSLVVVVDDDSLWREDLATFERTTDEGGRPAISFSAGKQGASKFARLTGRLSERRGRIAVIVDGRAVTVAIVHSRLGGSGVISGDMSLEECTTLVRIFRSGALPVRPILVSEKQEEPPR